MLIWSLLCGLCVSGGGIWVIMRHSNVTDKILSDTPFAIFYSFGSQTEASQVTQLALLQRQRFGGHLRLKGVKMSACLRFVDLSCLTPSHTHTHTHTHTHKHTHTPRTYGTVHPSSPNSPAVKAVLVV